MMTNNLTPVRCGCGGEAYVSVNGFIEYHAVCASCGMKTDWFRSKNKAVQAWNRAMGSTEKSSTVERTAKATRNPQAFFYHCECGYALCCEKNDMNYCPICGCRLEWE